MATVSTLTKVEGGRGNPSRKPYMVEVEIDLAAAATAKGSALAAADVINCINVGANQAILFAGTEIVTAPAGCTAGTFSLGITGGYVDAFVDGGALICSTSGTYATITSTALPIVISATSSIDMLLIGTTPDTSGVIRVFAYLMDVDAFGSDKSAAEVARDQV